MEEQEVVDWRCWFDMPPFPVPRYSLLVTRYSLLDKPARDQLTRISGESCRHSNGNSTQKRCADELPELDRWAGCHQGILACVDLMRQKKRLEDGWNAISEPISLGVI